MNKLNKKQLDERDKHDQAIHDALDEVEAGVNDYNDKAQKLYAELVRSKIETLNIAIEQANTFVDTLHSDAQSYYDDKSEKWQEGDRGQAYQSWIDSMDQIKESLEQIEDNPPADLSFYDMIDISCEAMHELQEGPEN